MAGRARLLALILAASSLCPVALRGAKTPVILISIDTLRADHLGAYGYKKTATPNLNSFAEHGTLYANADAQVPLTLPSHTSLFTSTYPFQNRIEENAQRVPPGQTTLAGVLRDQGYKTAAFIGSVFLEKEMGLDQGFDFYDSPFHYAALSPLSGSVFFGGITAGPNQGKDRREAPLVTRAALQWLRQNQSATFAFLHLYDLHQPYRLGSYDAELAYIDQVLGGFRKALVDSGLWDKTLVILLSDHGESLGEHGEGTHGYFIYEATLHVPLIIHWPGTGHTEQATRVEAPVGLIDVAPTILDFLGLPIPPVFAGSSLLKPDRLKPDRHSIFAESFHAHDSFGWSPLRSLRQANWKYVEAPRPELYDLATDPKELRDLYGTNPRVGADLRTMLQRTIRQNSPRPGEVKPQQNQALLNSLGYLSAGPGTRKNLSGADPKDRLVEFQMYEEAILRLAKGDISKTIAILRNLLMKDQGNTLARRDLGSCFLEKKDYVGARRELEIVVQVAPDDYATQYQLGLAYKSLHEKERALEHLNIACHLAPGAEQCRKQLEDTKNLR